MADAQAARLGSEPPQLVADLESAAEEVDIKLPETTELQPESAGRRYLEQKVQVKLRKVGLEALTKFLYKLETGKRPIFVSQMDIQRGFGGARL